MPSPEASEALIDALHLYALNASADQAAQAQRIIDFCRTQDAPWRRTTLEGHLTASAWIVNDARTEALLVHHKKLAKWLQPGGHIDEADPSVHAAALREAHEETGLMELLPISLNGAAIFDVDVHCIPARESEPMHFHYDIRFLFLATNHATTLNSEESNALRWFQQDTIATDPTMDASVRRMGLLARQLAV